VHKNTDEILILSENATHTHLLKVKVLQLSMSMCHYYLTTHSVFMLNFEFTEILRTNLRYVERVQCKE